MGAPRALGRPLTVALVALVVTMLLPAMNLTVLAPVLPAIGRDLGGDGQLPFVVTAHLLAATVVVPIVGQISDALGRKPLLLLAVAVFVVGSALAALAPTIDALIAARALQGLGGGAIPALVYATVAELVPPRDRGRYQGFTTLAFAIASVAGPPIGGLFADSGLWRWVFFLNVPVGLGALVAIQLLLPATRMDAPPRVDVVGAVVLAMGTTAIVLASVWGGVTYPWLSLPIVLLGVVALGSAAALLPASRRVDAPILPLGFARVRNFAAGVGAAFANQAAFNAALLCAPIFLQAVVGTTAAESGFLLLPLVVGVFVSSVVSGRAISRTGRYRRFPVLGTAMGTGALAVLWVVGPASGAAAVATAMGIVGVGVGMTTVVLVLVTQNAVPHRVLGAATSTVQFARMLGATLGVAVCGAVLNAGLAPLAGRLERASGASGTDQLLGDRAAVEALPDGLQQLFEDRLAGALVTLFLVAGVAMALACACSTRLQEVPLRDDVDVAT